MRFWELADGSLVTDEAVLDYLAAHGSLSEALASGDVRLVADSGAAPVAGAPVSRDANVPAGEPASSGHRAGSPETCPRPRRKLADYMREA